ncbi:MAG: hypothetical protein N2C12_02665 [Planctomycetales bacterium]
MESTSTPELWAAGQKENASEEGENVTEFTQECPGQKQGTLAGTRNEEWPECWQADLKWSTFGGNGNGPIFATGILD